MEQIVKLTGRIADVFEAQSGVSKATGNAWMSQNYLFEYFQWSGQSVPCRIVARVFGEETIKRFNLQKLEENITLTLRFDARQTDDGRWFNEIRITNIERAGMTMQNEQTQGEKKDNLPY